MRQAERVPPAFFLPGRLWKAEKMDHFGFFAAEREKSVLDIFFGAE